MKAGSQALQASEDCTAVQLAVRCWPYQQTRNIQENFPALNIYFGFIFQCLEIAAEGPSVIALRQVSIELSL